MYGRVTLGASPCVVGRSARASQAMLVELGLCKWDQRMVDSHNSQVGIAQYVERERVSAGGVFGRWIMHLASEGPANYVNPQQ